MKKVLITFAVSLLLSLTQAATIDLNRDLTLINNLDKIEAIIKSYNYSQKNSLEVLTQLMNLYDTNSNDNISNNLNLFICYGAVFDKKGKDFLKKLPQKDFESIKKKIFMPCSSCNSTGDEICRSCKGTKICKKCSGKGFYLVPQVGDKDEKVSCTKKCQSCPPEGTPCKVCRGYGGILKRAVAQKYLNNQKKLLLQKFVNLKTNKTDYITDFYYNKGLKLSKNQKINPAIECFEFCIKNYQHIDSMFALGSIYKADANKVKEAYEYFRQAADAEHLDAMIEMVTYFSQKKNSDDNDNSIQKYREKILEQADTIPKAAYTIATLYHAEGDIKQAISYYTKAADKKYAQAQLALGELYFQTIPDIQNSKLGFKYLQLAAKTLPEARKKLGLCYLRGIGVEQNKKLALKCLQESFENGTIPIDDEFLKIIIENANEGDPSSQFLLGKLYLNQKTPTQNDFATDYSLEISQYQNACDWFKKAMNNGHKKAKEFYKIASGRLQRAKEQYIAYDKLMNPEKYKNNQQYNTQNYSNQGGRKICADCNGYGFTQYYDPWQQANVRKYCSSCQGTGSAGVFGNYIDNNGQRQRSDFERNLGKMLGM